MNTKALKKTIVGLALSLLWIPLIHGADKKEKISDEMQAQMAKMKEYGTPGPAHAVLKAFEGNWNVTSRSVMKPGDKPQLGTGTSKISWILNGHFLKQEFKSDWMGQPFEGLGFIGYDNMKKEYVSVWMDSMATGIFQATGQYDATTKTIKDGGTFSCPMTGEKDTWFRAEWKIVNDDMNTYTMFMKDPSGKEYKAMDMVYKHAK